MTMAEHSFSFVVPGMPIAQPRPRSGVNKKTGKACVYRDDKHPVHIFRQAIRLAAQMTRPPGWSLDGPMRVDCVFVFPKTKKTPKLVDGRTYKTTKPDNDNMRKAVLDAMEGVAFHNDAQVCIDPAWKWHAGADEIARTEVTVTNLSRYEPDA